MRLRHLGLCSLGLVGFCTSLGLAACNAYEDFPALGDYDAGRRPRAVRPSQGTLPAVEAGTRVVVLPCPDEDDGDDGDGGAPDATVPGPGPGPGDDAGANVDAGSDAAADAAPDGPVEPPPPACVPTAERPCIMELALADVHTCARLSDGTVRCWGKAGEQLGSGTTTGPNVDLPTPVSSLTSAASLTAGPKHTCAGLTDGQMRCWGAGLLGRLGTDGTTAQPTPAVVVGLGTAATLEGVTAVGAGNDHTCALAAGGVACWGRNNYGQLADTSIAQFTARPRSVAMTDPAALATGANHVCVLDATKHVSCWGANAKGQVGTTPAARIDAVTAVAGLENVRQVSAGGSHTCALLASGEVRCFGDNGTSQLGFPNPPDASSFTPTPTLVENLPAGIVQIAAGGKHTCALRNDGTVYCWGSNVAGQLGGGGGGGPVPQPVTGVADALEIRTGANHTCARLKDGSAKCWGQNSAGQVGRVLDDTGAPVTKVETPTTVRWR